MIVNFRVDRDSRPGILERLSADSTLSQGWAGGADSSLDLRNPDFVANCKRHYGMKTTRIPTNLTRIRHFKKGDLLVVPHLPRDGTLSLHVVASDFPECYEHVPGAAGHLGHRIRVERSYGLDGQISIHNHEVSRWYAKLPWMRLPILPIPQYSGVFEHLLGLLEADPDVQLQPSELDEQLEKIRGHLLSNLRNELDALSPNLGKASFEAVCARLITANGYEVGNRNSYDGKGGDIDLTCTRRRSGFSPFETGDSTLFVQIKKHSGTSDDEAVKQLLRMLEAAPEADGCVMSLANDFTETAHELARANGIQLLNGEEICSLLLKYFAGESEALD